LLLAQALNASSIIDQIAVVVGKHAIKTSDIQRDLRVTQFLNNQPPDNSTAAKRASAQRLIDQEFIRSDLASAANAGHLENEANALLQQLVRDRFGGSEAQLDAELHRRSLTRSELLDELQWQLVVLRFIDERFRPGVSIADDQINDYYQQHSVEFKGQDLAAATPKIREILEGEQINRDFEDWLTQARKATRIDYKLEELK
jgi:hypothetical protein